MQNTWMIRAGRNGRFFKDFKNKNFVAVGWNVLAPLDRFEDKAQIKLAYIMHYENDKPSKTANSITMIERFVNIQKGDYIVTYCPKSREYLVGKDLGQYQHREIEGDEYANIRKVEWIGNVHRDKLSEGAKRSLMSVLTLFAVKPEIIQEFVEQLRN
ncbi:MAG: hypothetical protein OQK04_05275 [Kangiellaceae bacterium]|nr:hypothetical protein [Kangiellaceae bacterium]MCW8998106.1 hypothetical protein [Kangiellaceae bacterium]